MKTYIISYTIRDKSANCADFYSTIKSNYPEWQHVLEESWLIKTEDSAEEIFSKLNEKLPLHASLFIAEITNNCEGWIAKSAWEWLKGEENNEK